MATITNRVSDDLPLTGDKMDFVPDSALEERLKKAKKEQQPEAALPQGLVWPLPQQPEQPLRSGFNVMHHSAIKESARQPHDESLRPVSDLSRLSAHKHGQLISGATGKLQAPNIESLLSTDNNRQLPVAVTQQQHAAFSAESQTTLNNEAPADFIAPERGGKEKHPQESANTLAIAPGLSSKTDRPDVVKPESSAAPFSQRHSVSEAPEPPTKIVAGNEGQNKFSYTFTSWGSQHRVQLTTTRDVSQQMSVVMSPSDLLVSRRLQDAIASNSPGAGVVLREEAAGDEQQQRRDQAALLLEEDE